MNPYQVVDRKSGYTFERDDSGRTVREAVRQFENDGVDWDDAEISTFASRFSIRAFHDRMREAVDRAVENADTTPGWYTEGEGALPEEERDSSKE
jgi:hypothetical protein